MYVEIYSCENFILFYFLFLINGVVKIILKYEL